MTTETIVATFIKSSGVMATIDIPGEGTHTLPMDFKILKILKDGDKVIAGKNYSWMISINAKGERAILNVGPEPGEQLKTGKEILQENREALKKEKTKPPATASKNQYPAGVPDLPAECKTCVYVRDCPTLIPKENCKRDVEAAINKAKEEEQGRQRMKENEEYARKLAAEKAEKDKQVQKGIEKICTETKKQVTEVQKPVPISNTVIEAEIVKESAIVPLQMASVQPTKTYSDEDLLLIRNMAARNCSEPEFKLLMYLSKTYGLDPLLKQIWAVKRNDNQPALIFAGRDGFLAVAHRSGHFDGMQSGVNYEVDKDGKKVIVSAWCEVWRNDMSHSFKTEVPFCEYNTGFSVWKSHPSAMILKVAESVTLRKAFSIDGIYAPEEINTEG